ncbi:MAG: hypothetical protein ACJA11_001302 [Glaciecola sp.]|jgi:hypothetical protein
MIFHISAISIFLLFLISCTPLGPEVNKEVSENHFYSASRTGVIYGNMGNCFELGCGEVAGADAGTFKPLNGEYGIDAMYAYYKTTRIEGIKAESVRAVGRAYLIADRIYYNGKRFDALDPTTFQVVSYKIDGATRFYGKDDAAVYCSTKIISRDPDNFTPLVTIQGYFVDSTNVYTMSGCKVLDADPNSFSILKKTDRASSVYAKDNDKVFILHVYNKELEGANSTKFRALCSGVGSPNIAIDDNSVWNFGNLIENVTPDTFDYPQGCSK